MNYENLKQALDMSKAKFIQEFRKHAEKRGHKPYCRHGHKFIEWSEELQSYFCVKCGYKGKINM